MWPNLPAHAEKRFAQAGDRHKSVEFEISRTQAVSHSKLGFRSNPTPELSAIRSGHMCATTPLS